MQSATIWPWECIGIVLSTQASLCVRYAMEGIKITRSSQQSGFTEMLNGNLVIFVIFSEFCLSRVLWGLGMLDFFVLHRRPLMWLLNSPIFAVCRNRFFIKSGQSNCYFCPTGNPFYYLGKRRFLYVFYWCIPTCIVVMSAGNLQTCHRCGEQQHPTKVPSSKHFSAFCDNTNSDDSHKFFNVLFTSYLHTFIKKEQKSTD